MGGLHDETDGSLIYPWATTWSTIMVACTMLVMFVFTTLAVGYVDQTAKERAKELEEMPYDEEVRELEIQDEIHAKIYAKVSRWEVLPFSMKFVVMSSLILVIIAVYTVFLVPDTCFAPYALTSTIEKDLDGHWYNLVLVPNGLMVLVFFALSWFLVAMFGKWANGQANNHVYDPEDEPLSEPLEPSRQEDDDLVEDNDGVSRGTYA